MQREHWRRSQPLIPLGCLAAGVSLIHQDWCGFFVPQVEAMKGFAELRRTGGDKPYTASMMTPQE